jgi:cation diffusion facilitator CzcD-associated flavoprotein CzcO
MASGMTGSASRNGRGPTPSVVIVGAGFGGLGMGIRLKQAGVDSLTVLEKADRVGGVWRDNTYPGLTCDVPSHLYSFSFEPKHDWSRRFPPQPEILDYLEHCVRKYGLTGHLRLGTEVESADFDESSGRWAIRTTDGEDLEADVFICATGQLSRPRLPDVPGLEEFDGPKFHSARWDHGVDLTGKRVAVLGTGATAIQFVPEIARATEQLHVFQRSAPWVLPKPDRPYSWQEQRLYRRFPFLQRLSRAYDYLFYELLILSFTRLKWMTAPFRAGFSRRLEKDVPDPRLREELTPDYPMGCKRILISNDWYTTITRRDVELVTDPVARIERDAVVTADGTRRPVDAIIFATGFLATDFLAPMRVTGRDGGDLNEVWREGAEAYLGLALAGFPNLFILYGPNTNLGAGSIIYMLERQVEYVVRAVKSLIGAPGRYVDLRPEVQRAFNAEIQERLSDSVWEAGCTSWYRTEAGRNTNNWPGTTLEYTWRTRHPDPDDYVVAQAG